MPCMCNKCFTVFNREQINFDINKKWNDCPVDGCTGQLFKVDELIMPTVLLLNKHGYYTDFCCSGHVKDDSFNCYILFSSKATYKINKNFPKLPDGFILEDGQLRRTCLSYDFKETEPFEKYKEILKANDDLYTCFYDFFNGK